MPSAVFFLVRIGGKHWFGLFTQACRMVHARHPVHNQRSTTGTTGTATATGLDTAESALLERVGDAAAPHIPSIPAGSIEAAGPLFVSLVKIRPHGDGCEGSFILLALDLFDSACGQPGLNAVKFLQFLGVQYSMFPYNRKKLWTRLVMNVLTFLCKRPVLI